jgi:DNA-binding transcriptional LysR family regulator
VGRLLVDRADTVISTLESVDAELAEAAESVQGTVRIAAFQTAARFLVLPALEQLTRAHAQLDPRLLELEAEIAIPELVRGALDVVVAEEYPNAPRPHVAGTVRRDLLADEMRLAIPAGMRVPRGRRLDLARLAGAEWVTAREGTAYAEMAVGLCRSVGGFEPLIRHRANDLQLMLDLVAHRGCVAIVPALGTREPQEGIETRGISGEPLTRTIFVLARASDTARPSTAAALDALAATHQ